MVHKIPKKHVQFGVWVPDQVRPVQNAAMRRLGTLHSLALEVPASAAEVGAAPDANVVIRIEPAARRAVGTAVLAAVKRRVCTLAGFARYYSGQAAALRSAAWPIARFASRRSWKRRPLARLALLHALRLLLEAYVVG